MADNLSAKQITNWKKNVDTAILANLVNSLKKAHNDAVHLKNVTSGDQNENNLSYRFNDLAKLTEQASLQLTKFMNAFDTSLNSYLNTVKNAEATAAEKVRKGIDQFAEAASKIAAIKM